MSGNEILSTRPRGGIPRGLASDGPAILSYGFRPFFLGAALWAITAMAVWIGALTLGWTPAGAYGAVNWHAHEMLFGYTGAALAGFMLTAIPNWTGRLPVSGAPLALFVLLWLAGRTALAFAEQVGLIAAIVIEIAFLPALAAIAAREILAGRNWRNLHLVAGLSLLTVSNVWFHLSVVGGGDTGYALRLALSAWLTLITIIGGRLAVSFTRNWLARKGGGIFPVSPGPFDRNVLIVSSVTLLAWTAFPYHIITAALCAVAAVLHLVRLFRWRGWLAWREPLVAILHVAYGFIPFGFLAVASAAMGWAGMASAVHLLTIGAIGGMTLAVMTRASRGHTGNELTASSATTVAYGALALSALLRPAAELVPGAYHILLDLSGSLWLLAFAIFAIKYTPMLVRKRSHGA